jgi:RNA polymerase sigma-70 factor (ECF subfamily)
MDSPERPQDPGVDPVDLAADSAPRAPPFRAMFDAHFTYVWASLRRLGVADRDREDQANEVFFRVHQRLADFDPRRPVRPWLFAFAVRVASEYRKLARHRVELVEEPEAFAATGPLPDATAMHQQKRDLVVAALAELELDKRAVLILHELDETPIPEVATALGIPLGTAYSRLRAARAEFAAAARRISLRPRGHR